MASFHYDSRHIQPGDTFICLPKGDIHIPDALHRGAADVRRMTRAEFARFSDHHFGYPSRQLTVIGVTGTNGKTTVVSLLEQCLRHAGRRPMSVGTIHSTLTTPESWDTQQMMAAHVQKKGTHFIMEVSSHGIDQGRVLNIEFDYKCLTNITQDHLDYHRTFEHYRDTKMGFLRDGTAITVLPVDYRVEPISFDVPLLGRFNRDNIQCAVCVLRKMGIEPHIIEASMMAAAAPPGRFESIDEGQAYMVIVDYAHTPDGLDNVLMEASLLSNRRHGRLITVFGCGGDRDASKRPKMGHIARQWSDYVIITQDNPRTEAPNKIVEDIVAGIDSVDESVMVCHDRRRAINRAIELADAADVVVIAGKGHETVQQMATESIPFDDRCEARQSIRNTMT